MDQEVEFRHGQDFNDETVAMGIYAADSNVQARKRAPIKTVIPAITAIAGVLAIYLLRLDQVAGQFKDDGWYIVLARSFATGHGYNLIDLPRYDSPPLFPFLLSLICRIAPEFPRSVVLLKSVSIASMFVLSLVVFRLFDRQDRVPRSLALLLAFSTALAPSFVMLATSTVMSEAVFTTLQFAALLFAERCTRKPYRAEPRSAAIAALLAAAAYLTRTVGVALLAGIAIDFLRRKMFRELGIFAAIVLLCVGSWSIHQRSSLSGITYSKSIAGYRTQFWDRCASSPGDKVTERDLPGRVWQLSTVIVGDDIGALLAPSLYRSGSESGEELVAMTAVIPRVSTNPMHVYGSTMGLSVPGQLISLGLSIVVFIGFFASVRRDFGAKELVFGFSLLIFAVWPWPPIRFLVPLVPFFLYYLALGVAELSRFVRHVFHLVLRREREDGPLNLDMWSASRIVILCVLALFLYDNVSYLAARQMGPNSPRYPDWLLRFDAGRQAATWVRDHTPENEVIASDNVPMVYLYSGRKAEICSPEECAKKGIRYFVNTNSLDVPTPAKTAFPAPYHGVAVLDLQRATP